ncbi:hypothetical protein GCM10010222_43510 [Streptomyces tanashiensis]|nr:hypothetical protein GCM10010222_43510 [Streptomyces tanashiensis]
MRIHVTSVFVDDQDKALAFYTEKLGFVKKTEVPLGDYRWLTVVSPQAPDGTELLLEPDAHPAAKQYMNALLATASRPRPSPWTTSAPSTSGCAPSASASPRSRRRRARSPRRSWTTPAAI